MFVRFQSAIRDEWSRSYCGIFQAADDNRVRHADSWHRGALRRELDWFNENLDAPERRFYRPDRKGEISGLCWFRTSAHECIARARFMAWLLNDLGLPVDELKSQRPGRIIWQDDRQAVAIENLLN